MAVEQSRRFFDRRGAGGQHLKVFSGVIVDSLKNPVGFGSGNIAFTLAAADRRTRLEQRNIQSDGAESDRIFDRAGNPRRPLLLNVQLDERACIEMDVRHIRGTPRDGFSAGPR